MRCAKNICRFVGRTVVLTLGLIALPQRIAMSAGASFSPSFGQIIDMTRSGDFLTARQVFSATTGRGSAYFDAFGGMTEAAAISDDGTVIAGTAINPTTQYYGGWIRRAGGPYVELGTLGGDRAFVRGMSDDGKNVAGVGVNAQGQFQGFRWAEETGIQPIEFLPRSSYVNSLIGISADGKAVVGTATIVDDRYDPGNVIYDCAGDCGPPIASYQQAFLWTESGGSVPLSPLYEPPPNNDPMKRPPAPYDTYAHAISADGTTVVGYTTGGSAGFEGFVWRAETGMQALPGLPTQNRLFMPLATSGDGSIVVGGTGSIGPGAMIWDAQHGTRLLKTVLVEEYGLGNALGDRLLSPATFISISPDGLTIAGNSWLVQLPYSPVPEPGAALLVAMAVLSMNVAIRRRVVNPRRSADVGL